MLVLTKISWNNHVRYTALVYLQERTEFPRTQLTIARISVNAGNIFRLSVIQCNKLRKYDLSQEK